MEIKVGVIGIGPHFRETLLPALLAQDNVLITAFCDKDTDAIDWIKRRCSSAFVTDKIPDPDFWERIDCVVCCSWPDVHEQVLALAINNRKHCFCEKPAATGTAALDQLLYKQQSGLVIKVGHVFRYQGGSAHFIALTAPEVLTALAVVYLGSGPHGSRWGMSSFRSFSLTHLTHALDFVVAASGEIAMVQHAAWSNENDKYSVSLCMRTKQCGLVTLLATNAARAFTCKATAVLQNGAVIHLDNLHSVTLMGHRPEEKRSGSVWTERDLGTRVQNDGYIEELHDFFAEIRCQRRCHLPSLIDARHVLSVIEEIEGGIGL